jgi:hypothetical protein
MKTCYEIEMKVDGFWETSFNGEFNTYEDADRFINTLTGGYKNYRILKVMTEININEYYVVQQHFGKCWENCWQTDNLPTTFKTVAEAQDDLNEYLTDMAQAVSEGHITEPCCSADFRIVKITEEVI